MSLDNPPSVAGTDHRRSGGRFVATRCGRVFTRATPGISPTLLFLHDHPVTGDVWHTVAAHLPGRATLIVDPPGTGLSEGPAGTASDRADAVERAVLSHGIDRVVLVAHDTGAVLASELMIRDMAGQLSFRLDRVVFSRCSSGPSWWTALTRWLRRSARPVDTGLRPGVRDWPKPVSSLPGPVRGGATRFAAALAEMC